MQAVKYARPSSVEEAVELLERGGDRARVLAGGTDLIVLARERRIDVDLFVDAEHYRGLYANEERFVSDMKSQFGDGTLVAVNAGFAKINFADGGEVSVGTTPARTRDPRSSDTARGTRVPLETSREILAKKIDARMFHNATLVVRDLYDIAVARHYEPAALEGALRAIRASKLEDIAGELRSLPPGWMEKQRPRLIEPVRLNEARNAVAIVARIFRERQRTWDR